MAATGEDRFPRAGAMAALFLTVFAARLLLVGLYGHPLPFSDDWDAGPSELYVPYLTGQLSLQGLLAPHNVHRILTTRVLDLIEFELAGGWNVRWQMVVHSAFIAGIATWLAALLRPLVPDRRQLLLFVVTGLAFALPVDVEANLMGMNAQFYFLALFSIAALSALTRGRPLGLLWWSGIVWSALGYLSTASGALTPLAGLGVMMLQTLSGVRRIDAREVLGAIGLAVATGAMMVFIPPISGEEAFHAHSAGQFLDALTALAAIPLATVAGVAFVQAPILVHVWRTVRARTEVRSAAWLVVALAGWIALQMAALAYGRGALNPLASRYLSIVLLALPISTAILLSFARPGWWLRAWGASWFLVIGAMVPFEATFVSLRMAREMHQRLDVEQPIVTAFLKTGDDTDIAAGKTGRTYPKAQRFIALLSDPLIQSIVPDEIQPAPPHPLDRSKLLLKGGLKPQIDQLTSLLPQIAAILGSLAAALWLVAGYLDAARRDEPAD